MVGCPFSCAKGANHPHAPRYIIIIIMILHVLSRHVIKKKLVVGDAVQKRLN